MNVKLSLIISTYNWPEALELVLRSVMSQKELPFEVIIADDGSREPTKNLIESYKQKIPCPLIHIWQEDNGFQLAQIRNKAAAASKGNYLVFIDGDCLIRPSFVKNHLKLASPGRFTAGNRALLGQDFSNQVITEALPIETWKPSEFNTDQINRSWALHTLPIGPLRSLKSKCWRQLKGCNFAIWKEDLVAINGLDESFIGWGYEDSELTIRLLRHGLRSTSGRLATTVLHLWHKEQDRSQEQENWAKLQEVLNGDKKLAEKGIDQYL